MPDQRSLGGPEVTRITELVRLADRFGLTWGRRPGTVMEITGQFTPRQPSVVMDGDDRGIPVVSLVGILAVGDRVMVDRVPPAGHYAVGLLNRDTVSVAPEDVPMSVAATTSSATIIAEAVSLTVSVDLRAGSIYRVEAGSAILAATATPATYRLRKGTTTGGTLWAQSPSYAGLAGVSGSDAYWVAYLRPIVDVATPVSLTLSSTLLGAMHVGTTTLPRYLSVTRVPGAAGYPQAVAVS